MSASAQDLPSRTAALTSGISATADRGVPSGLSVRLLSDEPGRPAREVAGIACDNLRGMPEPLRDHLVVVPPAGARVLLARVRSLPLPVESKEHPPRPGRESAGSCATVGGRTLYYPPDEFNPAPTPGRPERIVRVKERSVLLTLTVSLPDRPDPVPVERVILLRRPPVVLIHGVNATAALWQSKEEAGYAMAHRLAEYGFDLALLDHGAGDVETSPGHRPEGLLLLGNGPVEYAAELLDRKIESTLQAVRAGSPSFAIRRVDAVGHSYGGVIARWYLRLASRMVPAQDSRRWYTYAVNNRPEPALYKFSDRFFAGPPYRSEAHEPGIRKLITVGSPWRGTPIANYVNQVWAPNDPLDLRTAPILYNIGQTVGSFLETLSQLEYPDNVQTKVPSMEVCAVESPWLRFLNGRSDGGAPHPFLDDVAYASLAGDDTAIISERLLTGKGMRLGLDIGIDLYNLLSTMQAPTRFPYLALDRRAGSVSNYSDGLIPVWSALIPYGEIVSANHNSLLADDRAIEDVLVWLNSANLPTGRTLNPEWHSPIESNVIDGTGGQRKHWTFRPGFMAPWPQCEIYGVVDGTARILPGATPDVRQVRVKPIPNGAALTWETPIEMDGTLIVYRYGPVNFGRWDMVALKTIASDEPVKVHNVTISDLEPGSLYYYKALSDFSDPLDGVLELQSDMKQLHIGH